MKSNDNIVDHTRSQFENNFFFIAFRTVKFVAVFTSSVGQIFFEKEKNFNPGWNLSNSSKRKIKLTVKNTESFEEKQISRLQKWPWVFSRHIYVYK